MCITQVVNKLRCGYVDGSVDNMGKWCINPLFQAGKDEKYKKMGISLVKPETF